MKNKDLIPRRRVLGLGVALAGLCAGCAVLPAGSTESAASSQTASWNKASDKVEKASLEDINSVHLRDNPELYTVYDDSGVVTMYLTVSRGNDSENTNHSWAEINHYSVYDYETMGVPRYQVNARCPASWVMRWRHPTPQCRSVVRPPVGMLRKTTK